MQTKLTESSQLTIASELNLIHRVQSDTKPQQNSKTDQPVTSDYLGKIAQKGNTNQPKNRIASKHKAGLNITKP